MLPLMESRDLIPVSRRVSRLIFASFGLILEGHMSRSLASCLETFNTTTIWLSTTVVLSFFLSAVFADYKQPKQLGILPKIRKNLNFEMIMTFLEHFQKNISIIHTFEVSSLGFLDEVSVSKFTSSLDYISVSSLTLSVILTYFTFKFVAPHLKKCRF